MSKKILSLREVCEILEVNIYYVYEWRRKGKIRTVKRDGVYVYYEEDIERIKNNLDKGLRYFEES